MTLGFKSWGYMPFRVVINGVKNIDEKKKKKTRGHTDPSSSLGVM